MKKKESQANEGGPAGFPMHYNTFIHYICMEQTT